MVCAQQRRHHGSVHRVRQGGLVLGLAAAGALQRRALDGDPGHGQARQRLQRRGARHRRGGRGQAAGRHRLRVDRAVAAGEGLQRADHPALHAVDPDRVPVPGGAVRELGDPLLGHHGGAARRAGRAARRHPDLEDERRVFPGGPADHHRPGIQERHPDRRIRQGTQCAGDARGRGGHDGGTHAPAPHPDDVAGLHPRRRADGHGQRCRRRRAARAGHGGHRGMLSGTVLAIFFVPLFFVLVRGLFRARPAMAAATTAQPADAAAS